MSPVRRMARRPSSPEATRALSTLARRVSGDPNPAFVPTHRCHVLLISICYVLSVIYIADDWFQTYVDSIPGAYYDGNNTGLIVIPFESIALMEPFTFYVSGVSSMFLIYVR